MVQLTEAQVLAAAATDRLIHVISSPGSGKTTVAAERYGYLRYQAGDLRGVLGLTFNRAAAAELRRRIELRWGADCIRPAHRVITFDHLHVDLLTHFLRIGRITWRNKHIALDVHDDYRGFKGFRFLKNGEYKRIASLGDSRSVISAGIKVTEPCTGIGNVAAHLAVLESGIVNHEDVRSVLRSALGQEDFRRAASDWLAESYRALVIDEVYDGDDLDLCIAYMAAEAGLSVTIIGDPWQALYRWRGAKPEVVGKLLDRTSERFIEYKQSESFRFIGDQMPQLAAKLRDGIGVTLPHANSSEVDVALARKWTDLWSVGDNVLPLSFHTVNNAIDAAMNLLLDVVTRARLGTTSYGRESAIIKLGLDRENFQARQEQEFMPIIDSLLADKDIPQVLDDLRQTIKILGGHKPRKLSEEKEIVVQLQLARLAARLGRTTVIPGLTVFQAKGREWERVGVVLSRAQLAALASGLQVIDEEHCITYVAITRAKRFCGHLTGTSDLGVDQLQFDT